MNDPMTNQPAPSDTPLSGEWRFNNGVLCCGTLRIAKPDFDTNPSDEFKAELFRWLTETLNNAARLSAERDSFEQIIENMKGQLTTSERQRKEMEGKVALVARALELALIPLAVFKITEADQPYTEHSPSLKKMLSEAHDAVCEALQSLRSTPETKP